MRACSQRRPYAPALGRRPAERFPSILYIILYYIGARSVDEEHASRVLRYDARPHAAARRGEAWAAARLQRQVVLDVDDEHVGKLVEAMNARKAELVNMDVSKQGPNKTRIEYTVGRPAGLPAAPLPTVPHLPILSEPN